MDLATEPTRIVGYVTTLDGALIGVLIAFGINIDEAQRNAILAAVGTMVPVALLMVEVIRSRVVSPASAGEAVAIAKMTPSESNVVPDVRVENGALQGEPGLAT